MAGKNTTVAGEKVSPETTEPEVEVEAELTPEQIAEMLMAVKGDLVKVAFAPTKAAALAHLGKIRAEYNSAKAVTDALKAKHDMLVLQAQGLRTDFSDVEKIEKRGAPKKA